MGQHRDSKTPAAPHDCPQCGEPGYIPFALNARCTNRECQWYDKDLWVEHVLSLPDELDIEDDPTEPNATPVNGSGSQSGRIYSTIPNWTVVPTYGRVITQEEQEGLDLVEAAIDKMPVPFILLPDSDLTD